MSDVYRFFVLAIPSYKWLQLVKVDIYFETNRKQLVWFEAISFAEIRRAFFEPMQMKMTVDNEFMGQERQIIK